MIGTSTISCSLLKFPLVIHGFEDLNPGASNLVWWLHLLKWPDMPIIIYNVVYCTQSIPTGGCFARNPPGWKSLNNTVVFKGINRSVEHKETKPDKNILRPYIDDSTWWSCFKIEEEHRGFWEIPLDYKRSQSGGTGLGVSKPNNMYI